MADFIIIAVLLLILIPAVLYIRKEKKKGTCIGCPAGGCAGCHGCHSAANTKQVNGTQTHTGKLWEIR